MLHNEMLAVFPAPFGAEDHENRGVNDREIRFKPFRAKVYAQRADGSVKEEQAEARI